ncbi:MAG: hypothetical protein Tsb0015_00810 [Simkaniaceae bacterium]
MNINNNMALAVKIENNAVSTRSSTGIKKPSFSRYQFSEIKGRQEPLMRKTSGLFQERVANRNFAMVVSSREYVVIIQGTLDKNNGLHVNKITLVKISDLREQRFAASRKSGEPAPMHFRYFSSHAATKRKSKRSENGPARPTSKPSQAAKKPAASKQETFKASNTNPRSNSSRTENKSQTTKTTASGDPYEILGIKRGASDREIKLAYNKKALEWHPDKNKSPEATEMFQKIGEAYNKLKK